MIRKWFPTLFKKKYVNPYLVRDAILDYRADGKKLMFDLGRKYSLDIENAEDYQRLVFSGNQEIPRKGKLSERWNYYFHGCECGFFNKKHQQRVEVVLSNSPDFGHIDAWFLLSYMESTKKFQNEVKGITWQELKTVIDRLYETNEVEAIN